MSRDDHQRLVDIAHACSVIRHYLEQGDLREGLIFDAVRMRLVEIGEAAKAVSPELLSTEPSVPWSEVVRMRDRLTHRYFDTLHSIVEHTATHDLDELAAAVDRMTQRLESGGA